MVDDYTAQVKLDDGTVVKLDQEHVETVIPSLGRQMMIVNGAYRGQEAVSYKLQTTKVYSLTQKIFFFNFRKKIFLEFFNLK